jgi:hypothetical protein
MPSNARIMLRANRDDFDTLWKFHEDKAGLVKGRKYGVEVLNKAVVIFVCAAWEAYCEDVVRESSAHLAKDCSTHDALPEKIKALIGEKLRQNQNPKTLWTIAGDGWRQIFLDHVEEQVTALNTPKPHNLSKLFESTLGLKSIESNWKWNGCSNAHAKQRLISFVELRGEIAHRQKPKSPVHKRSGKDFFSHISILADLIDESVGEHIGKITRNHYW